MSHQPAALCTWDLVDNVAYVQVKEHKIESPALAQELGRELEALLRGSGTNRFVLDLERVKFLSSTGFATLLMFARKVEEAGGAVRMGGLDPGVRIGADIIGLGRFIPIHPTADDALRALTDPYAKAD